ELGDFNEIRPDVDSEDYLYHPSGLRYEQGELGLFDIEDDPYGEAYRNEVRHAPYNE
ncbi:hypothetical protein LCGC14_2093150, partial [marine sediment metagenome]